VEWKFAQYSYYLGNAYGVSDEEAEKVLKKGLVAARIAKRMEPNKPEGFFWYGAVLGEQSKRNPVTVGVVSFDDIKEAMNKVIEIDPTYQGASAYDALGLVELKTVGLAGGNAEKAVEILEKGVEIEKNNSFLRLHLAEAYLAVDKKAEAKKQIDYILNMKPDPEFLPEYERSVMEAQKLLEQKF
jgi:tetratricopeptide (TPR) repeat protein